MTVPVHNRHSPQQKQQSLSALHPYFPPDAAFFLAEPPHVILRLGLIKGLRYSTLAADMGAYLARTLFFSSALHLSGPQMKAEISRWASNWPMCELTEKVRGAGGSRLAWCCCACMFLSASPYRCAICVAPPFSSSRTVGFAGLSRCQLHPRSGEADRVARLVFRC